MARSTQLPSVYRTGTAPCTITIIFPSFISPLSEKAFFQPQNDHHHRGQKGCFYRGLGCLTFILNHSSDFEDFIPLGLYPKQNQNLYMYTLAHFFFFLGGGEAYVVHQKSNVFTIHPLSVYYRDKPFVGKDSIILMKKDVFQM